MIGSNLRHRRLQRKALLAWSLAVGCWVSPVRAQVETSALDAPMFYQLLIGEMELSAGRAGNAFQIVLDAARRQGSADLYRRAIDIALQAREGEHALTAAKAWRKALPESVEALRYLAQILVAFDRPGEMPEPLSAWLALTPSAERANLIAALPRLLQRAPDRKLSLTVLETALKPYLNQPETRTVSRVSLGRMMLAAGQAEEALRLTIQAAADDAASPGPALLALDMPAFEAQAERIVIAYLSRPDADLGVRLAYVRVLTQSQRFADAITQLALITAQRPEVPEPWLTLGALHVELRHHREADAALQRYVQLAAAAGDAPVSAAEDEAESDGAPPAKRDLTQAWLLLAQTAELRGDLKASEAWLAKIDNSQRALDVQARRATLLARQGKLTQARELIQSTPERSPDDARAKVLAEAHMLREVKRWRDAAEVLQAASIKFPTDVDLAYEWAMVEEKRERFADMERLLRRVIELKPDHPHAHNALGYSLADRRQRLPEARDLIRRALEISPGDPFITDSLGWVEFRLGNREEALRLLRQAYQSRPDAEIGVHLGEVLWASGQRDEARRVWLEARGRDANNEVLRETLARLKVGL